ncbi:MULTISPECIES: hypothetical protein [Cytophagales]|nr:hypothetical protein [Fulvivirga kasyanovii]MBT28467.1 hypothetical protein [Thalassovita sp.]MTI27800.1 hypothetical protein [Fulvivirga kasyanovii]WKN35987.1 hypothetical protein K4G66_26840 [Tunicatimonas sp. TK19036]HNP17010.1 hypothetical protein [Fulvivirga sp.]
MEADRIRKPGSVRLTDEQYEEMEALGLENESAYVKYKLSGAQKHLQVLRDSPTQNGEEKPGHIKTTAESVEDKSAYAKSLEDKLTLQKLSLENEQLKQKLEEISRSKEESLSGIHNQVEGLLKDELLKRDFDTLKKENAGLLKDIEKLEKELEKSEEALEEKSGEIEELVKKLSLVELGKVLLPGAINGLATKYPKEMQGLASTLGSLSGEDVKQLLPAASLSEEQQNLLNIAEYFRELFDDEQFEQVVQMVSQLGEQVKEDETMISKVIYYLNQMSKIRKAQKTPNQEKQNEQV